VDVDYQEFQEFMLELLLLWIGFKPLLKALAALEIEKQI
jgi:hypothetical protein